MNRKLLFLAVLLLGTVAVNAQTKKELENTLNKIKQTKKIKPSQEQLNKEDGHVKTNEPLNNTTNQVSFQGVKPSLPFPPNLYAGFGKLGNA